MATSGSKDRLNGHAKGFKVVTDDEAHLPPQNIDMERGILGEILLGLTPFARIAPILAPDDFFRDTHGIIYRTIADLDRRGIPIDERIVSEELNRLGHFEAMGGHGALIEIVSRAGTGAFTDQYAATVREKSVLRKMIDYSRDLLTDVYRGLKSPDEVLADADLRLKDLSTYRSPSVGEAVLVRLADVESKPVEWLWPGRIALSKVNIVYGDPGLGKSFFSLAMGATVSVGGAWPDAVGECAEPGSVILLSAEDALADTVRPRLDAAGADVSRIHALTSIRGRDGRLSPFNLRTDLPRLEDALARVGDARLLVIDPVTAYLGGTDEFRNAEIRALIGPLSDLAERHRVAVILVTHLNKGTGKALYRATGSLAFIAAARMAWLISRDPQNHARRRFVPSKTNIIETPTGMAYQIVGGSIQWEPEPLHMDADDALAEEQAAAKLERQEGEGKRGPLPVKTRQAMEWLLAYLANGPQRHGPTRKAAEEAGFASKTFYNALDRLEIERFELDGRQWLRLPQAADDDLSPLSPF
jgi:putative DNA primase/helicase